MCAAVGAPDAYAGELPMAFVTLMDDAQVTEDALLAHVAQRVDEAPARPKRVIVIDEMPMTNVGKIYKPDLRRLATAHTVTTLAQQAIDQAGLNEAGVNAFRVLPDAQPDVGLEIDSGLPPALKAQIKDTLDRLPVKVTLTEVTLTK